MADSKTTNFSLNLPEFDKRFWTDEVNDNFILIDALIKTYLDISGVTGVWMNSTAYEVGQKAIDPDAGLVYEVAVAHTSAASPTTFGEDRLARPSFWVAPVLPVRGLGNWTTATAYIAGDFVVANGVYYAICISDHVSGATFLGDTVHWDILIDVSSLAALPSFVGHGGHYVRVKTDASNLEYVTIGTLQVDLGLGTLAFSSFVLGGMAAQQSNNVAITGGSITGVTGLTLANLGEAKGVAAGNLVVLDGSAKLPAVDGSQLINLNIPSPSGSNLYLWSIF
jgi:hypothetical protein